MVYLIDDKKSRQADYGWDDSKIAEYKSNLVTIYNIEELEKCYKENMLEGGNTILLHESFVSSVKKEAQSIYDDFKNELDGKESALYVSYFSGSKNCRYVQDNVCMLSPSTLYENLETFLLHELKRDISLKYLAFGERYDYELELTKRVMKITETDPDEVSTNKNIFFAVTSDSKYALDSPFSNVTANSDWDTFGNDISDINLDKVILNNFCVAKYDAIYIPLCFGNTYSDFMGLRLALHLRLTQCVNQTTRLFIYGVVPLEDLMYNECFDVLKLSGISLIESDYESIITSDKEPIINEVSINEELDNIRLTVPNNIGDNHSFANRWAIYRWREMIDWGDNQPEIFDDSFIKSLYFKYLITKFGAHDSFRKDKHKYKCKISNIEKKRIVYIDDEYNLGWENILKTLIEASGAKLICYKGFDKKINKTEQIGDIKKFLYENDADCYLLDLRLHSDDFDDNASLSGHEIAASIKTLNQGNQIVVFTASNKIWNLKQEIGEEIGALDYVLKESPEMNLNRDDSKKLLIDFMNSVSLACKLSDTKEIVKKQKVLKIANPSMKALDCIADLLTLDRDNKNQNILGATLLAELSFIENFIKDFKGYFIDPLRKGPCNKIFLMKKENKQNKQRECKIKDLYGHIFVLRDKNKNIIEISEYNDEIIETPNKWCDDLYNTDCVVVATTLLIVVKIPIDSVNLYIKLKRLRNTQLAHHGITGYDVKREDIIDLYENVVYPMIKNQDKY